MAKKKPEKTTEGRWQSRITGTGFEDAVTLCANPRNWRTHPQEQQAALAGVLDKVGWVQNVVVNQRTGFVVDGHLRASMALAAGEKVPVLYVDLSEEEEALILTTLDPVAGMATRDADKLKALMGEIAEGDLGALGTGLDSLLESLNAEIEAEVLPPGPVEGEDDAPEVPVAPLSVPGDIWLCGSHRVLCGDSTSIDAVSGILDGRNADLIFTDPPYGVGFQSGMSKGGTATRFEPLANDDKILDIAPVVASVLKDDGAAFIWTAHQVYPEWRAQFDALYKHTIIWHKRGGGIGDLKGSYATDYEMCLFCVKGRPEFRGKRGMAVWTIGKDNVSEYRHPTQKPVELAERAILDFTDARAVVLDLFGGSGSTLIACEKTKRHCRLMELDPKYVDVIVKRWQEFTGKKATLDGDGRTFDEIAAERQPVTANAGS